MNHQLISRLKSFAWRAGMVALAAVATYLASPDTIADLGLPAAYVGFAGLVLGEVSKYLNNKLTK
jgi:hypothetical protein